MVRMPVMDVGKKNEEVQLEAKVDKLLSDKQKRERRNKAAGMEDKKFNSLSKDQVSKQNQEFRRDYIHSEKRGVKKSERRDDFKTGGENERSELEEK